MGKATIKDTASLALTVAVMAAYPVILPSAPIVRAVPTVFLSATLAESYLPASGCAAPMLFIYNDLDRISNIRFAIGIVAKKVMIACCRGIELQCTCAAVWTCGAFAKSRFRLLRRQQE
jgi:hypothetical protein